MKFYKKPSSAPSFKQIELISQLRSQVGEEEFLRIKKKLRLKREVTELSRNSCTRLISALIEYRKSTVKTNMEKKTNYRPKSIYGKI